MTASGGTPQQAPKRVAWWTPRGAWRKTVRFVTLWDRDAFKLVVLSIPLTRGISFITHIAPPQLNDEVIRPPFQSVALLALALAAFVSIVGILSSRLIVERLGMHVLGPCAVLYAVASASSNWRGGGAVTLVVYLMIAACCFRRAHKITLHLQWIKRLLIDAADAKAAASKTVQ